MIKEILKFIKKHKVNIIFILIIIVYSSFIRLFLVASIPTNITGDEVTLLSDVYRIILQNNVNLLNLTGDTSTVGIIVSWYAFWVKIFGFNNTIFALRFSTVLISILSLIIFYIYLKEKTSKLIGFIFTILLSGNYVFLNFSRTAWVNLTSVFLGLLMILLLDKAEKYKKFHWYVGAGFIAGLSLYGYAYSRILIPFTLLYLFLTFVNKRNRNLENLKMVMLFTFVAFITFLPFLINAIFNHRTEDIFLRPSTTYAFSQEKITNLNIFKKILSHQLGYTLRGFIFLDGRVMSDGIENMRYLPLLTSPVNLIIKSIFILSLIYIIFKFRRNSIWIYIFISIMVAQFLSDMPPNFSRGIFYIPFIYLTCGIFIFRLFSYLIYQNKMRMYIKYIFLFIILISFAISLNDITLYFKWMNDPIEYNARQPAIDYNEFKVWQKYQISRVKSNLYPVNNYEWYEIRKSLIKN